MICRCPSPRHRCRYSHRSPRSCRSVGCVKARSIWHRQGLNAVPAAPPRTSTSTMAVVARSPRSARHRRSRTIASRGAVMAAIISLVVMTTGAARPTSAAETPLPSPTNSLLPTPTLRPSQTPTPHNATPRTATASATQPRPAPPCGFADVTTVFPRGRAALSVLDTTFRLPSGWHPPSLTRVQGGLQLQQPAAEAWRKMRSAAANVGIRMVLISAYRSEAYQHTVFNRSARKNGRAHALRYVARPGHSEHQLGMTVDLGTAAGVALEAEPQAAPKTRAAKLATWLAKNAADYGWVRSYPQGMQGKTCYASEPWHWRFVGVSEARAWKGQRFTLREFLWLKRFAAPGSAVAP